YHAAVLKDARTTELCFHVAWLRPVGFQGIPVPGERWAFGVLMSRVTGPECLPRRNRDHPHWPGIVPSGRSQRAVSLGRSSWSPAGLRCAHESPPVYSNAPLPTNATPPPRSTP